MATSMSQEVGETRGFPEELLLKSFSFLNVAELVGAARVCRRWHRLSEDDTLWEAHLLGKPRERKKRITSISTPEYSVDSLKWGGSRMPGQTYRDVYVSIVRKQAEDSATYQKAMEEFMQRPKMPKWGHYACGMRPCPRPPTAAFGARPNPPQVNEFGGVAGFKMHPNRSVEPIEKLSIDISAAMRYLLAFLEVHAYERRGEDDAGSDDEISGAAITFASSGDDGKASRNTEFLANAMARYKRFMHLKAKFGTDVLLVPTVDIEVVWQAHAIRPSMYAADCEALCARLVDHCLELATYESFIFPSAALRTAQLYWETYQTNYMPEANLWTVFTSAARSTSEAHVAVPGHAHPVLRGALSSFLAPCAARVTCCPAAPKAEWVYHCAACNVTFCSICVEAGKVPAAAAPAPAEDPNSPRISRYGEDESAPQRPTQQRCRSYLAVSVPQDFEPAVPTEDAIKAAAWNVGMTVCDVKQDFEWIHHFKSYMPKKNSIYTNGWEKGQTWMDVLPKAYERFLYMAARYPPAEGEYVHPTYAIDLAWHAHMLHPVAYANDCKRLVGHVVDHEPWPPIAEDTKAESHNKTDELWKAEFGVSIHDEHKLTTMEGATLALVPPPDIGSDSS